MRPVDADADAERAPVNAKKNNRDTQWAHKSRAVLKRGEKKVFLNGNFAKKIACSSHIQPWLVAIGGWRLATGGCWRLVVVGGGWWLVVGG